MQEMWLAIITELRALERCKSVVMVRWKTGFDRLSLSGVEKPIYCFRDG